MKPMLACSTTVQPEDITYPVYMSFKLDGIRCVVKDGKAMTRSLKPIPNDHIRTTIENWGIDGVDGEIMIEGDFNKVQSVVMSKAGRPAFKFCLFDMWCADTENFYDRYAECQRICIEVNDSRLVVVAQNLIPSARQAKELYNSAIEKGFEGLIAKAVTAPYKFGRSTLNQGYMLKLKPSNDAEAVIIDVEEMMHNENDASIGELGQTKRSKEKAGLVGSEMLGSFVVRYNNQEFRIGSGFDQAQRIKYWRHRKDYIGKTVTFKYQEISSYGIPRFPVFKGFRNSKDL